MSKIALQIERTAVGSVIADENVLFNSIVYSNGNISYNPATGLITFNESGQYQLNWWVNTQSSASAIGAGFALVSSQADNLIGNSPIKTGEVVGIGIIEVATAPVTLELKNISEATIYYSPIVPVKASLTVAAINEAETSFVPQGTFFTYETGPFAPAAIIPITDESSTNTPGAFEITEDGRVRVLNAGVYLADGRMQLATGSSGVMGLQKNDESVTVLYHNSGTCYSNNVDASGLFVVSTVLILDAGDTVSLLNFQGPQFTIELLGMIDNTESPIGNPTSSPAGTIRLVRLSGI